MLETVRTEYLLLCTIGVDCTRESAGFCDGKPSPVRRLSWGPVVQARWPNTWSVAWRHLTSLIWSSRHHIRVYTHNFLDPGRNSCSASIHTYVQGTELFGTIHTHVHGKGTEIFGSQTQLNCFPVLFVILESSILIYFSKVHCCCKSIKCHQLLVS